MPTLECVSSAEVPVKDRFDFIREEVWQKRNSMDISVVSPPLLEFFCEAFAFPDFHLQRVRMSAAEIFRTRLQASQAPDTIAMVSWSAGPVFAECSRGHAQLAKGQALVLSSALGSRTVMPKSEFVCVSIDASRLQCLLPGPSLPSLKALAPSPLYPLLMHYLTGLINNSESTLTLTDDEQAIVTSHLYDLVAACLSKDTPGNADRFSSALRLACYQRACGKIDQSLFKPDLSVTDIARQLGVSIRYLQGVFNDHEETCRNVIRRKRLELAHQRLVSDNWRRTSIIQIALSVGFSDHSHFTKCFKRYYGRSPRSLRSVSG
jgi:AraC-like DNA-binding protein